MLGRITLNPLAHIDWIGTVLFPIVAMLTRRAAAGLGEARAGELPQPQGAAARLRDRSRRPDRRVICCWRSSAPLMLAAIYDPAVDQSRTGCSNADRVVIDLTCSWPCST